MTMDYIAVPSLGLGMRSIKDNRGGIKILEKALTVGYRLFDTSPAYNNERLLGKVIKKTKISRREIFIITKIPMESIIGGKRSILLSIKKSISFIDYIDLLLLEGSSSYGSNIEAWNTLINVYNGKHKSIKGKIKAIGVSNYSIYDLDDICESKFLPMFHQFELSPFVQNTDMVAHCEKHSIKVIGHTSLGNYLNKTNRVINTIARKRKATFSQIMLRWSIQKGMIVLCGTTNEKHLVENYNIVHFCMSINDYIFIEQVKYGSKESYAIYSK